MTRDDDIRRRDRQRDQQRRADERKRQSNLDWDKRSRERRQQEKSAPTPDSSLNRQKAARTKPRPAIKAKTTKRAGQEREYSATRKEYLARHPFCHCRIEFEENEIRLATEIHHTAGRQGDLLCYEPFFMAVCNPCHVFIHARPMDSCAAGMLLSRLESREQQMENLKLFRGHWPHVKRELERL